MAPSVFSHVTASPNASLRVYVDEIVMKIDDIVIKQNSTSQLEKDTFKKINTCFYLNEIHIHNESWYFFQP